MKYNFTKIIDRHGKDAIAIDGIGSHAWGFAPKKATDPRFDEIPMWVADMNFETAPSITRALEERIRHPLYGYFQYSDQYYQSIIDWQSTHHGYIDLKREEIGYENGVHGCVMSAISLFTQAGDAVLLHSPAYVGFIGDLLQSGRKIVYSPLKKDPDGIWRMDYEDMDRKIKKYKIRLAIFCSPHNPTGRVWEREELENAMEVYRKNHCLVLSDEIWSDIIFTGHKHIPTCLVNEDAAERTIGMYAPSKTFNLAGLIGSYHIIRNPMIREKMDRYSACTHYNDMNVLSMHALIGAYSEEGAGWVKELNQVLEENCRYAVDFINNHFEGCSVSMPQGTYMLFVDCEKYLKEQGKTLDDLLNAGWDVGVAWQDGRKFADPCSIRMNCALPLSRVKEAMERLQTYVFGDSSGHVD